MTKSHFIGEPITVEFDSPPQFSKKPDCPDRIVWRGELVVVTAVLDEWRDYRRRGRMAQNMQPAHLQVAEQRGSWGVGRTYFRVRVMDGRTFEIYYDRAPKDSDDRSGSWFLTQELL
ncbi:MAG: hypothetical protein H6667_11155 [Ardenticatenaceae bacterium]|nr:hypothetical protein [Ardenticatenaceae bacterium]MCB9444338.1 hypothetical protein [Ardenticatenaceae bacterium]